MNVRGVLEKSSDHIQTQVIHNGCVLFQGQVREFWNVPDVSELKTRHVRLVYVQGSWLRVVVGCNLRPLAKKAVSYALLVLLGLLFGWSMQGVWF